MCERELSGVSPIPYPFVGGEAHLSVERTRPKGLECRINRLFKLSLILNIDLDLFDFAGPGGPGGPS